MKYFVFRFPLLSLPLAYACTHINSVLVYTNLQFNSCLILKKKKKSQLSTAAIFNCVQLFITRFPWTSHHFTDQKPNPDLSESTKLRSTTETNGWKAENQTVPGIVIGCRPSSTWMIRMGWQSTRFIVW